MPTCLFKSIRLAVADRASQLHPAIPAPADDLVPVNQYGANRNATLRATLHGFSNCGFKECVGHWSSPTSGLPTHQAGRTQSGLLPST